MKKHFIISGITLLLGIIMVFAGLAQAVTLTPNAYTPLPGTTVADNPNLAGSIVIDDLVPFSFSAYGGTVSGEVQVRVVYAIDNTYDFYWRVFNDPNSSGAIQDLRIGNFFTSTYNADYRTDGLGDVGPSQAYLFGPPAYPDYGYVNFYFGDTLTPGTSSKFFFLDTNATNYAQTALYDLTNIGQTQISGLYPTYAPAAVPEPASLLLLGSGLVGLGLWWRFKAKS